MHAPAAAVTVRRNEAIPLGGPARYDAKKGAVLGASLMTPKH
jgi:hypothetical protein